MIRTQLHTILSWIFSHFFSVAHKGFTGFDCSVELGLWQRLKLHQSIEKWTGTFLRHFSCARIIDQKHRKIVCRHFPFDISPFDIFLFRIFFFRIFRFDIFSFDFFFQENKICRENKSRSFLLWLCFFYSKTELRIETKSSILKICGWDCAFITDSTVDCMESYWSIQNCHFRFIWSWISTIHLKLNFDNSFEAEWKFSTSISIPKT